MWNFGSIILYQLLTTLPSLQLNAVLRASREMKRENEDGTKSKQTGAPKVNIDELTLASSCATIRCCGACGLFIAIAIPMREFSVALRSRFFASQLNSTPIPFNSISSDFLSSPLLSKVVKRTNRNSSEYDDKQSLSGG